MYPVLILREEAVCLILLVFLAQTARSYNMGKDSQVFRRILIYAMAHVVMDIVTVITVNHIDTVPGWVNYLCHILFYLAAILYSLEILHYVLNVSCPEVSDLLYRVGYVLPLGYLAILPLLRIEYTDVGGSFASTGSAAFVGYGIAFVYFFSAIVLLLIFRKKLSPSIRNALLPMMVLLILAEVAQILRRDLLFTGGAVAIVTIGFFFSLENPAHVFELKLLTDVLTGMRSRSSYEQDLEEMERAFALERNSDYLFAFCDINFLRDVNNRYGHHEGDNYICLVATALGACLGKADGIYRIGGDEFLVKYYRCPAEDAVRELESVQPMLTERGYGLEYTPGVSIGYAVSGPDYRTLSDVIRTADHAMYRSKSEAHETGICSVGGADVNIAGLTNRIFEAICSSADGSYPFISNPETNVTRVSPAWRDDFSLDSDFLPDFCTVWARHLHSDDRTPFRDFFTRLTAGQDREANGTFRVLGKDGRYLRCDFRCVLMRGEEGEPDLIVGYMYDRGPAEDATDPMK